jgi:hypothetical protein
VTTDRVDACGVHGIATAIVRLTLVDVRAARAVSTLVPQAARTLATQRAGLRVRTRHERITATVVRRAARGWRAGVATRIHRVVLARSVHGLGGIGHASVEGTFRRLRTVRPRSQERQVAWFAPCLRARTRAAALEIAARDAHAARAQPDPNVPHLVLDIARDDACLRQLVPICAKRARDQLEHAPRVAVPRRQDKTQRKQRHIDVASGAPIHALGHLNAFVQAIVVRRGAHPDAQLLRALAHRPIRVDVDYCLRARCDPGFELATNRSRERKQECRATDTADNPATIANHLKPSTSGVLPHNPDQTSNA